MFLFFSLPPSVRRAFCALTAVFFLFSGTAEASEVPAPARKLLRVGYIESSFSEQERTDVDLTFSWLRKELPQYEFDIRRYSVKNLETAIKEHQVDFFLGASGFYRRVFYRGLRDLATMTTKLAPDPGHGSGTVFIVKKDSPYETVADLKGARAATSWSEGFTGVFIPMGEIASQGENPDKFFNFLVFGSPASKLLDALLEGKADVAMARSCAFELLEEQNPAYASQFRAVGVKPNPEGFRCMRSTELYPNWTLVSTSDAPWSASSDVTRVLLSMPQTPRGTSWGVVSDFAVVDDLYRTLKRGPYSYLRIQSLDDFVKKNRTAIMFVVLVLLGLVLHSYRAAHLVRERTAELQESMEKEREAVREAKEARDSMQRLQQVSVVGSMSSLIAHELNGPLSAIANSAAALQRFFQNRECDPAETRLLDIIESQCGRAASIVGRVRSYAKRRKIAQEPVDLALAASRAAQTRRAAGGLSAVLVLQGPVTVLWDRLEAELAATNLIKNAEEALRNRTPEHPEILVSVASDGEHVRLTVTDNALSDSLEGTEKPLVSEKEEGLGLGLLIVRTLAERASGHFSIRREAGLTHAEITLPDPAAAKKGSEPS